MKTERRSIKFGLAIVSALTMVLWASWAVGWVAVLLGWEAPLGVVIGLTVLAAPVLLAIAIAGLFAYSGWRDRDSSAEPTVESESLLAPEGLSPVAAGNS